MASKHPDWKLYERFVARLFVDQLSTDLCLTLNARLRGRVSEHSRQIDVLIDRRHDTDNSQRIIVDAKKRNRKIDVTHVEAFKGLMEDVGARHGYLVCPVGYTKSALKRAEQLVSICLVPFENLESIDPTRWDKCVNPKCTDGFVLWDGFPELSAHLMPLNAPPRSKPILKRFIHHVGKCDRCGRFHVKCLTCGELFFLKDDDGDHQCQCKYPWFWLASIEKDENGFPSAELHVVMGMGRTMTVNRRPM